MNVYPDIGAGSAACIDRLSLERIAKEMSGTHPRDMTPQQREYWMARAAAERFASCADVYLR